MRHVEHLPDETIPRLKVLVENSAPDPHRPRLPPDVESSLEETDRAQAGCYAGLEEVTFRTERLAEQISKKKG